MAAERVLAQHRLDLSGKAVDAAAQIGPARRQVNPDTVRQPDHERLATTSSSRSSAPASKLRPTRTTQPPGKASSIRASPGSAAATLGDLDRQEPRPGSRHWRGWGLGRPGFQPGIPTAQRAGPQAVLLTVQPQRQPAALPASHVIPPELLPIPANPAVGHPSLHRSLVSIKSRPEQTGRKDAFVAG